MTEARILFSTVDSEEAALQIARRLVDERLAACVSIIPNVTSVYKWKGAREEAREYLLVVKTSSERLDALILRLREIHPYEVPEAIAFSVEKGDPPYLDWLASATQERA